MPLSSRAASSPIGTSRIAEIEAELAVWRHDFHAHPELGFEEVRTSGKVAELLRSWGLEVTTGIATTGVVGTLRRGSGSRAIGLRADMDALPMQEANAFAHRSTIPGRMHACGHDGHTAMLLGAAKYLAGTGNFSGVVHFIFQPAEEGGGGARVMLEEGLFERFPCAMVFGAHNDPSLPLGTIVAAPGTASASSDRFDITISGRGGHAAHPHLAIDPVVVGAHVVLALQTVVARRSHPREPVVLSITRFHAGSAGNVIPDEAELSGTVRTLDNAVRDEVEAMMQRIVAATAEAHEATAELRYRRGYPSSVNAPEPTARAAQVAARLVGAERVVHSRPPGMGGEDFSYLAQAVPGCFLRFGQADGARGSTPVHNPRYDFNDQLLPLGASFWAMLVEQELPVG